MEFRGACLLGLGSCGSLSIMEKACLEDTSNLVQSKSFNALREFFLSVSYGA